MRKILICGAALILFLLLLCIALLFIINYETEIRPFRDFVGCGQLLSVFFSICFCIIVPICMVCGILPKNSKVFLDILKCICLVFVPALRVIENIVSVFEGHTSEVKSKFEKAIRQQLKAINSSVSANKQKRKKGSKKLWHKYGTIAEEVTDMAVLNKLYKHAHRARFDIWSLNFALADNVSSWTVCNTDVAEIGNISEALFQTVQIFLN